MAVDAFMQQVLLILSAVLRSSYLSCTLSKNIPDYPHSTCSWKSTPALIWADMEQFRATLIAYPFERSFIWHVLHLHALTTRIRHSSTKKKIIYTLMQFQSHTTKLLNWIFQLWKQSQPFTMLLPIPKAKDPQVLTIHSVFLWNAESDLIEFSSLIPPWGTLKAPLVLNGTIEMSEHSVHQ